MTNYITKSIQVIFSSVFKGILAYLVSGPKSIPGLSRTFPDFPGLLLVFVLIMSDKAILDHKMSYLVYFENFHFLSRMTSFNVVFCRIEKNKEMKFWLTIYSYFDVSMIMAIIIKKNKYRNHTKLNKNLTN